MQYTGLCAGNLSLAPWSPSYFLCWIFSCGLAVCVKQTRAPARWLVCANHWSLSKMILVPTDQRSFSRLFVVTCLHRSMVSFPPTHSTCLYKPMVSYPSPPHLSVQTHGLLSIPPPVCTDPWSLAHPPHLSV